MLFRSIHAASLSETVTRFGGGTEKRMGLATLLSEIVLAASDYLTIKRVLVWGSFLTDKPEPNDLDYSLIVSEQHRLVTINETDARFLIPVKARMHYGTDTGFLVISDYPLEDYTERLDFLCHNGKGEVGIIEICSRGERSWKE